MNDSAQQPLAPVDMLTLLLLSAIWGFSYLFMRMAVPVMGPVFLIEMRVLSAFLVVLPVFLIVGGMGDFRAHWGKIFILSLTNMALPFCLFAYSTLSIGAGPASILNAAVPFFTAIIAFALFRQALTLVGVLGLVVGFAGVVVLAADPDVGSVAGTTGAAGTVSAAGAVGAAGAAGAAGAVGAVGTAGAAGTVGALGTDIPAAGAGVLLAIAAGLLGSFCYGLGANLTARYLHGVSGLTIATGNLFFSSLYLAPLAWLERPAVMPGGGIWLAVVTLGAVCTGLAFVLFYHLIARIGSTRTVTVTLLMPLFSIFWAWLILGEQVTPLMAFGCLLVLTGVSMTTGRLPVPALFRKP